MHQNASHRFDSICTIVTRFFYKTMIRTVQKHYTLDPQSNEIKTPKNEKNAFVDWVVLKIGEKLINFC